MIYTSYYSNKMLRIAAGKFRLIGISRGIPEWFTGGVFRSLAPSWTMIHMRGTQNYISLYRSQVLTKLNPHEVMSILDNSILLCWEKAGRFCHRRLVDENVNIAEVHEKFTPNMMPDNAVIVRVSNIPYATKKGVYEVYVQTSTGKGASGELDSE